MPRDTRAIGFRMSRNLVEFIEVLGQGRGQTTVQTTAKLALGFEHLLAFSLHSKRKRSCGHHGRAIGRLFGSGMRPVIGSSSLLAEACAFGARLRIAWAASR